MFNELNDLADELAGDEPLPIIRVGNVDSVDAGPPVMATVDGLPMRCLASYPTPTAGDVVVYLAHDFRAICLGPRL